MPAPVVARARILLRQLERRRPRPETNQLSLFGTPTDGSPPREPAPRDVPPAPLVDPIREALAAVDPDALSPREAQAALYRLRELLR
jgi:DNA mismatch repair protein MutS